MRRRRSARTASARSSSTGTALALPKPNAQLDPEPESAPGVFVVGVVVGVANVPGREGSSGQRRAPRGSKCRCTRQTFLLVACVQVYLGPVMVARLSDNNVLPRPLMPGVPAEYEAGFGTFYVGALILWSVSAIFFGLLLQVLWQERPLSDSLA